MIGKDFDDLGRAIAGRQSRRSMFKSSLRSGTLSLTRPRDASRVDALSKAIATPISRRGAIGALSGALVAAGTLRARPAQAATDITCGGTTPQKCTAPGGAQVCVGSDWHCWSNSLCVGACKPWELYGNNGCNDTPLRCYDSRADFYSPFKTRFCSVQLTDRGTFCSGGSPRNLKWGWCCKEGEVCGSQLNACTCTGEDCVERCCGRGTYCATNTFSPNLCLKSCPDGSRRCGADCCGGRTHCGGDRCVCTAPFVSCGPTDCCSPKKTTADPNSMPNWWDGWLNMMRSTSDSHKASGSAAASRQMRAHTAAGSSDAVSALSAVAAQRTVTLGSFTDGHHDRAYKRKVVVARPSPPKLQAGTGLDAGSALALNALMKADAKASALLGAAGAALARSRAAMAKDDRAHARSQMLASAHFADQAAKALKPVTALRAAAVVALRAGATTEVIVTTEDVVALQAAVRRSGVPAPLRTQLRGLGLTPAEIARLRKTMLDSPMSESSIAGAALIAPLADATRTTLLAGLPGELTQYARQARSHPIARGHG